MTERRERRKSWWIQQLKELKDRSQAHSKKSAASNDGKLSKKRLGHTQQSGLTAAKSTRGFRSSIQGRYEHTGKSRVASSMLKLLESDSESSTASEENEEPPVATQPPKLSSTIPVLNPSKQAGPGKYSTKSKPVPPTKKRKGETFQTSADDVTNKSEGDSSRKRRYILFIGNLPYTASQDDIIAHFEKRGVAIKETRLLTKKESGKSRGCCFAEFADSTSLQKALKLNHTQLEGRRINIEVTCGGGGTSEERQRRIKRRNKRLLKVKSKKKGDS